MAHAEVEWGSNWLLTRDRGTAAGRATTVEVDVDVVVVGAGFAGLYQLQRLRSLGFSVVVLEGADDVGGTWYWNRYPGARCDIMTVDYSYSWDPELEAEWQWSEKYATQPEILRYLQHVAAKHDLRRDIRFSTRVEKATWDEEASSWRVRTSAGDEITCRHFVMATGCLSLPKVPDIEGAERFQGDVYSTTQWPHDGVDFTGKRVAVIGTGSSGVQSIPIIAEQASQLTVFQRTPNYSRPAKNGPVPQAKLDAYAAGREEFREAARWSVAGVTLDMPVVGALQVSEEERRAKYEEVWESGDLLAPSFADILTSAEANDTLCEFIREKIRSIVNDPETAESLCPKDHFYGTKRPCLDTNYFETFNLPHVRLVDLRKTPLATITETGIDTAEESFEFDVIVFATGFDAMTGAIVAVDITGRDGLSLAEKWADGPRTYLGLTSVGFPNLFLITGPGSPSVLSNMAVSIEQHVEWVSDCIRYMRDEELDVIEPTPLAEAGWVQHVNDYGDITLFPRANSWYMGANVPGKPRVFLPYVGGVDRYRKACDEVAGHGYLGFAFDGPGGSRCHDGVVRQVQPDVQIVLDVVAELGLPPLESMSVEDARAFSTAMATQRPPGPEVGEIVDGTLPGAAGDLAYRLYRPATPGPHPVVVYFHGGGWVLGSADSDDPLCRDLCVRSGAVIISVDYRHAPEARFPARHRRRVRGAAVGGLERHRARWHPRPAGGVRLERRGEHRRGRLPAGPRCRRPGDRRPGAAHAGHRQRHGPPVVRRERRRVHPDHAADAVVLGPLRRRGRPDRSAGRAAAGQGPLEPPAGADPHLRVRPAARRGRRVRQGVGVGGQRGAPPLVPRPHPHLAHHGRPGPVGRLRPGGDGGGPARALRCRGAGLRAVSPG